MFESNIYLFYVCAYVFPSMALISATKPPIREGDGEEQCAFEYDTEEEKEKE